MLRRHVSLLPPLAVGLLLGGVLVSYARGGLGILASIGQIGPVPSSVIRCAAEVETDGWQTFRSTTLGFEVRYPQDFTLSTEGDRVLLTSLSESTPESILFEKTRGTLKQFVLPGMQLAGWKVFDRNLLALATSYYTTSDHKTLSAMHLFVRGLPITGKNEAVTVVRATVTTTVENPAFSQARKLGIVDPESILARTDQILSTFRFLQFEELPGRDGQQTKASEE